MARIKKNLRRITIEKEACKKLSNHQGSSKTQTTATLKCDKMSMVSFGYYKKFPKIIEAGPNIDIQMSDRLTLNGIG